MEDAYVIGIRLVLENGVSAGIASLQDDLAAYDRALGATGARLRDLTGAGHALAAPVSAHGTDVARQGRDADAATDGPAGEMARHDDPAARSPAMPPPVATKSPPNPIARAAMSWVAAPPDRSGPPERRTPAVVAPGQSGRVAEPMPGPAGPEPGQAAPAVTVLTVSPPHYARYARLGAGG